MLQRTTGNIKEKENIESDNYPKSQWDDDIFDEVSSVTDSLVSKLGSMKSLLMSLPKGFQEVYAAFYQF